MGELPDLKDVLMLFERGQVHEGYALLSSHLNRLRLHVAADGWREWCRGSWLRSPVREFVLQEPMTRHSAARPRGYPGDAQLLDLIYGIDGPPDGAPPGLGKPTTTSSTSRSRSRSAGGSWNAPASLIRRQRRAQDHAYSAWAAAT
jgi:hypothetical protein